MLYKTHVKDAVLLHMLSNTQSELSYPSLSFILQKLLQRRDNFEIVLFALGNVIYEFSLIIVDRVIIESFVIIFLFFSHISGTRK